MSQKITDLFPVATGLDPWWQLIVLGGALLFTFGLSEAVMRTYISWLEQHGGQPGRRDMTNGSTTDAGGVGVVIGKCENLIVFSLVCLGQYEALGLVLAAKSIARMQDMKSNPSYYLAGTLLNFVCSLVGGLIARALVLGF
ncbi:MAG TPA: hypothetical protein VD997_16615 [Phycisphaerales bacterium]|nr:hypothetical protein [Phycisphaerales bacterium]